MELKEHFNNKIFHQISETADELGLECYVVGGYVRDIFLNRPSKDIDVVVVGSGIEMAEAFGKTETLIIIAVMHFVAPAVLSLLFHYIFKKIGLVRDSYLALEKI